MDRNSSACRKKIGRLLSLSARRAWIEIPFAADQDPGLSVALRKESVDRNTENAVLFLMTAGSLSARRAWIEIGRLWL